jgi:hypothetical protein
MIYLNQETLRNGLDYITTNQLSYAICQTEPTTLQDCTGLSGISGKRVTDPITLSNGEITVTEGANIHSLDINVPAKTFQDAVRVPVAAGGANLWLVVYDGTRWIIKTNEITSRELLENATVLVPSFTYGIVQ